jgi:hypothetical protein
MALRSDFKISTGIPEPPPTGTDFKGPARHVSDEASAFPIGAALPESPLGQTGVEDATQDVFHDPRMLSRMARPWGRKIDLVELGPGSELLPHKAGPPRVAMLVTHGMGQQVPYETLSATAQALITQHSPNKAADPRTVVSQRVTLTAEEGAPELSRVEVLLEDDDGKAVLVHVYESYWAPLTEGQISFLETVGFLYSAAWNGIKTCLSPGYKKRRGRYFDRFLFEDFHEMKIGRGTLIGLLLTVLSISLLLVPAFLLFTPIGLGLGKNILETWKDNYLAWSRLQQVLMALGLVLFAAFAYWVHYFVVEFVGDVAIYVSSYKVSRFDAIRNSILEAASKISRQIYSAGIVDHHELPYDSVVIAGHSLGSVISYDLLNAAINWDQTECDFTRKVVDRTSQLITFGSPLDKTAFLFRTQVKSARNLRESLAARQQPLIMDYSKYRPIKSFRWINIYSPMDIISGSLKYYDIAANAMGCDPSRNPVENRIDPEARTPLLAHIQYWENDALHKALYEAVWAHASPSVLA